MNPVGGPIHLTDDQARQWFVRMVDPGSSTDSYRLIFSEGKRPVGEVSFHRLNPDSMTAEFNIKVASTERGKGYAREAVALFLDYFFIHSGGRVLIDDVALDDQTGWQVLLRLGSEHDPSVQDVVRLRMTQERYEDLHGSAKG